MKRRKIKITESSGNVFRDLGFSAEEAENLRVRAELMLRLRSLIQLKRLTQTKAAKVFGVSQPRISDLVCGRIDRFSTDMLITMLARAGMHVAITVTPKAA